MIIRCKVCSHPILSEQISSLVVVTCPACKSDFCLELGERTISNYELRERLGGGAYGDVWRGLKTDSGEEFAVKIMKKEWSQAFEVQINKQLDHANIVPTIDAGCDRERQFVVTKLIDGPSLDHWLEKNRPTPMQTAKLCGTIAEALEYAHQLGIVHRDLKPGNILIDSRGEPHIIDFGVSRCDSNQNLLAIERYRNVLHSLDHAEQTNGSFKGPLVGTLRYMSPEQARGEGMNVEGASDVYSLGAVMYELLTGRLPFNGQGEALVRQILRDRPPSPRRFDRSIPRDLEYICLKALAKNPADRFLSAASFASDCQRFVAGLPVHITPPARGLGALYRIFR